MTEALVDFGITAGVNSAGIGFWPSLQGNDWHRRIDLRADRLCGR